MTYPLYELGGTGPVIHLALANGFPPQTYVPVFSPLFDRYRVVSSLPRALWPDIGDPPEQVEDWSHISTDMLASFEQHDLHDVIAVGHSFGGVASLLAVLQAPERFRALILLDPTILDPAVLDQVAILQQSGKTPRFPLVDGALKRRSRFPDVQTAADYFRGKPLFADWTDEAVRRYAESLTGPAADGDGLELIWSPAWEAYYYRGVYAHTWTQLPKLRGLLPTLIIGGATTDAFVPASAERVKEILPEATHVTIPDYGHLFPQAAPNITHEIIRDWLAERP